MATLIATHAVTNHGDTFTQEALQSLADASVGQVVWFPDDPQGSRVGVVQHAYAGLDLKSVTLTIKVDDNAVIFLDKAPTDWRYIDQDWR